MDKNRVHFMKRKLLHAINYCNTQIINPAEYYVISVLFKHVGDHAKNMIMLENLANEAAASQASISRFIKKIGYASYQEFRGFFLRSLDDLWVSRKNQVIMDCEDTRQVVERKYAAAIENLKCTYDNIDQGLLEEIVKALLSAKSVTIIGDDHVLSIFYTVQLDLLANGIPAYLFKNMEMQMLHAESLGEKDVLLFVTVSKNFITAEQRKMLEGVREKTTMIGFFQEDDKECRKIFDMYYVFGKEHSSNEGFYSLWLISCLLSELLYIVKE